MEAPSLLTIMNRIDPGTWAAYATARMQLSELPPAVRLSGERIASIAERTGGCPWATLALVNRTLPELDLDDHTFTGRLASLCGGPGTYYRPVALAPTVEALDALMLQGDVLYADVVDPWGRPVPRDKMAHAVHTWRSQLNRRSRLIKRAITVPDLREVAT